MREVATADGMNESSKIGVAGKSLKVVKSTAQRI